jgi:hypothetical protein
MLGAAKIPVWLQSAFRTAVTEGVAEVASHHPHKCVKSWCANGGLEFLAGWHPEAPLPGKFGIRHEKGTVIDQKTMLRDERGGIEAGPRERTTIRGRGKDPVVFSVALERRGYALKISLHAFGTRVCDGVIEQRENENAGGES